MVQYISLLTRTMILTGISSVNFILYYLQDLCKYCRGELKPEQEVTTIQSIISHGLEREELRNEIFVQCMRQATNNPSTDSLERLWLMLCLCVVAFQPSKLLHKVNEVLYAHGFS